MEACGKAYSEDNAIAFGEASGLLQELQGLGHAAIQIFPVKRFARGNHEFQVANARGHGPFVTFYVGHQSGKRHARKFAESGRHTLGVRHLRHPLRMNEAGRLNMGDARVNQFLDKREFVPRGHRLRFVLQSVASRHIDNSYFFTHGCTSSAETIEVQSIHSKAWIDLGKQQC